MSDPLSLLREHTVEQKPIQEDDRYFSFGTTRWPKTAKTNYITYGSDKQGREKEYYTLESIIFLIRNADMKHSCYAQKAAARLIQVVNRPDRKNLLAYVNGEINTCTSIDYSAALDMPSAFDRAEAATDKQESQASVEDETKKVDEEELKRLKDLFASHIETSKIEPARTVDIVDHSSGSLFQTMTVEKIAEIKAKRLCKKRTTIKGDVQDADLDPEFRKFVEQDAALTKDIMAHEFQYMDRKSILQTTGKGFENIWGILKDVKAKQEAMEVEYTPRPPPPPPFVPLKGKPNRRPGFKKDNRFDRVDANSPYNRYDQERFKSKEETEGFAINPLGSYHTLMLQNGMEKTSQQEQMTSAAMKFGAESPTSGRKPSTRAALIPIIIVPSTPTSLISLFNATQILEELTFVTAEEMKAKGARRDKDILVNRQKSEGVTVPYRVIDTPLKLDMQEWGRVVAVFVLGPPWQFKNWPWCGNPTEIFANVCGFHLKYDNTDLDANVAKWAVNIIEVSRNKRYLDRAALKKFWEKLDTHIATTNPNLRY